MFRHPLSELSPPGRDADAELRLLEERNVEELAALTADNRDHLREWLPWVDASSSLADTRAFVRSALAQFARGDGFQAGIWSAGALVGVIGYHRIDAGNRRTSLGYWLAADAQGRGLMTAAARALVDHAFGELGLNRAVIDCATGNTRSRAVPERLGFTLEGVQRQAERLPDRYVDIARYGLLAQDWRRLP